MEISGKIHKGTFGKKDIYFKIMFPRKKPKDIFVILHGSYSSSLTSEKDLRIARKIIGENAGAVLIFETSRKRYSFESKDTFETYRREFGNKSFLQELDDMKEIVLYVLKERISSYGIERYHFIGFSLGGTIASYFIPILKKKLVNIFLFNSGITTKVKGSTYAHYPDKHQILENYKSFHGNIFLIQTSEDKIVPQREARKMLTVSKHAQSKHLIKLLGIDHSFRLHNGKLQIPAIAEYISDVILGNFNTIIPPSP